MGIIIKEPSEIEGMKEAGKRLSSIMEELFERVVPGISTGELDRICEELIRKYKCIPILKGYEGFPASSCISVNDQVGHGIPAEDHFIDEGDIVKIDTSVSYNGWCADAARTLPAGEIAPELKELITHVRGSFNAGLAMACAGRHLNEIGSAIEQYAEQKGYSVVRDMMGHGIGCDLHEEPQIPNFNNKEPGPVLEAGMVFAIEPMINIGEPDIVWGDDDWTVYTEDYSFSAHYENTVLITNDKPIILTDINFNFV